MIVCIKFYCDLYVTCWNIFEKIKNVNLMATLKEIYLLGSLMFTQNIMETHRKAAEYLSLDQSVGTTSWPTGDWLFHWKVLNAHGASFGVELLLHDLLL